MPSGGPRQSETKKMGRPKSDDVTKPVALRVPERFHSKVCDVVRATVIKLKKAEQKAKKEAAL